RAPPRPCGRGGRPPEEPGGTGPVPPPAPSHDGEPMLGPGADGAVDALGFDLLAILGSRRTTGEAGECVSVRLAGTAANPALRLVLLVGLGDETPADFRRAGAALARATLPPHALVNSLAECGDGAA